MSPRLYLLERFRADAQSLRERAAFLRTAPPQPGPDASTSLRMADACDDVLAMISAIPEQTDALPTIDALTNLIPLLSARAAASDRPPVRAVYAGAATRIREVAAAEHRHHDPTTSAAYEDDEDHEDLENDEDRA